MLVKWISVLQSCSVPLMLRSEYWLPEELSPGERTASLYLWSRQTTNWGLFVSATESILSKSSLNTISDAPACWLWGSAEGASCKSVSAGDPGPDWSKGLVLGGSDRGSCISAVPRHPAHSSNETLRKLTLASTRTAWTASEPEERGVQVLQCSLFKLYISLKGLPVWWSD